MPKQSQPTSKVRTEAKKVDPAVIVALITLIGTIIAAILASPVLIKLIEKNAPPKTTEISISVPTNTLTPSSLADVNKQGIAFTPTIQPTPTNTLLPTIAPTAKLIPTLTRTIRPTPISTPSFTPTKTIPCAERSSSCYEADIFVDNTIESAYQGVGLSCGPKGGFVLGNEANFRFTRGTDSIKDGIFPERKLQFTCISQVDFLEMGEEEKEAVNSYYQQRSDFFGRNWQKARITLVDGAIWDDVFIYDNCSFDTPYETIDIRSFNVVKIVFRAKENCD